MHREGYMEGVAELGRVVPQGRRRGAHRHPTRMVAVGYFQAAGQCNSRAYVHVCCMVPPRSDMQVLASCRASRVDA